MAIVGLSVLTMTSLITGIARRIALRGGLVDVPNDRSSHHAPTPRGGGVSIVVTASTALLILYCLGAVPGEVLVAIVGGGLAVAAVGLIDDRQRVSARVRIVVHVAAAVWALGWLGGLAPLRVGDQLIVLGWAGYVLGVLGIVWVLNLFNFMDGIDGIAASEAVFVCFAGGLLAANPAVAAVGVTLGCACLGFLRWNWPPARIFMGDVGSGYLGYAVAVLALAAARSNSVALWVWLILGGVFFVDATMTLVRRLARGERVYQAHRSHAYQWIARRWGSHRRVTIAVMLLNILWLLPWALFASLHPHRAAVAALVALVPLVGLAISAGSGRNESPEPAPTRV
jgi:Fuc2NAc and GlcNAc transferase